MKDHSSNDSDWNKAVDELFDTINPLSDATQKECDKAVSKFLVK